MHVGQDGQAGLADLGEDGQGGVQAHAALAAEALVRLALSKEVLKTMPMPSASRSPSAPAPLRAHGRGFPSGRDRRSARAAGIAEAHRPGEIGADVTMALAVMA
jgi:hypothetical protein